MERSEPTASRESDSIGTEAQVAQEKDNIAKMLGLIVQLLAQYVNVFDRAYYGKPISNDQRRLVIENMLYCIECHNKGSLSHCATGVKTKTGYNCCKKSLNHYTETMRHIGRKAIYEAMLEQETISTTFIRFAIDTQLRLDLLDMAKNALQARFGTDCGKIERICSE